jgi:hypothetical protein
MMTAPTIRVTSLGLQQRDAAVFTSLVSLLATRREFIWKAHSSADADVIVMDFTAPGIAAVYNEKIATPGTRLVVICPESISLPQVTRNVFLVRPPLKTGRLLQIFDRIQQSYISVAEQAMDFANDTTINPASVTGTPVGVTTLDSSPLTSTVSQLVEAMQLLRTERGNTKMLNIQSSDGYFACLSEYPLREIYVLPHEEDENVYREGRDEASLRWEFVTKTPSMLNAPKGWLSVTFDTLAWQVANRCCHTLESLDVAKGSKIRLMRWPVFKVYPDLAERAGVQYALAKLTRDHFPPESILQKTGMRESDLACLLAASWMNGILDVRLPERKGGGILGRWLFKV